MQEHELWIIFAGILVAVSSSLLGSFLILRKSAMIGDAISHAVLPGIILSFMIFKTLNPFLSAIGATIFGILCALLIEMLVNKMKLQKDVAIGLTYISLFSLGIILISIFGKKIDVDKECVLYGEIIFVALEKINILGFDIPEKVLILFINLIVVIVFLSICYKGLLITTFNSDYAKSLGISTSKWNYLLIFITSFSIILSFESVGAILVLAFLVLPPSTSYLICNKLKKILKISVLISIISSILGYFFASLLNLSVSASIAFVMGLIFLIALTYTILKNNKINVLSIF